MLADALGLLLKRLAVHPTGQWLRLLARLSVMESSCRAGADEGSRRRRGDTLA
jgi:hypothetical protein